MKPRLFLTAAVALAVLAAVTHLAVGAGPSTTTEGTERAGTVELKVGDTVRVPGAPLECQVTRRDGRVTLECRRTGGRKGTYGTFLDARTAVVARFRSATTAQTVFTARHHGDWTACTGDARARAARERCR